MQLLGRSQISCGFYFNSKWRIFKYISLKHVCFFYHIVFCFFFKLFSGLFVENLPKQLVTLTKRLAQKQFTNIQHNGGSKNSSADESLEEDTRHGRPSDVDNHQPKTLVETNLHKTVLELDEGLSFATATITKHL